MEASAVAAQVQETFFSEVLALEGFQQQVTLCLRPGRIVQILRWLQRTEPLCFDHLRALTAVDNLRAPTRQLARFEVVYILYALDHGHEIRLRAQLDATFPIIDSVASIWPAAEWWEREIFDLFGIRFRSHPDLRRILLPTNWQGHPLRKDSLLSDDGHGQVDASSLPREVRESRTDAPASLAAGSDASAQSEIAQSGLPSAGTREKAGGLVLEPQLLDAQRMLQLEVDLVGERIKACRFELGYLHRGMEKLAEHKSYSQALLLAERLDAVATLANTIGYCVAVERLLGLAVPLRAQYIRTMVAEMSRICSHLYWLAGQVVEVGLESLATSCLQEREQLLGLHEELAGSRILGSLPRLGGVRRDVSGSWLEQLQNFVNTFPEKVEEYTQQLACDQAWLARTKGVGRLTAEQAVALGLTGVNLRATGVSYDLRTHQPYDAYDRVDFVVPVAQDGDCYARSHCRLQELQQSARIMQQCIEQLPAGSLLADNAPELLMATKGAARIEPQLTPLGTGFVIPVAERRPYLSGDCYAAIEAPKGELGFYLISDGTDRPYRMHIRSPSFVHIGALSQMCEGEQVATLRALWGSLDVVVAEADR